MAPVAERPERLATTVATEDFAIASKPLSTWETVSNNTVLRKVLILVVLALIWELYARHLNNELLVPTFSATVKAFVVAIVSGGLLDMVWASIKVLLIGYGAGIAIAALLTTERIAPAGAVIVAERREAFS